MILFLSIIAILFTTGLGQPAGKFSKEIVAVLKPILAIGVVLHHCSNEFVGLVEFKRWGALIVGIFFFISGYGLTYSVSKNPQYICGIIIDKVILKLLIPCLIVLSLHVTINCGWLEYDFLNHASIKSGPSFFPNDWFMYVLIYSYLLFTAAYNTTNKYAREFILVVGLLIYEVFTIMLGYGRHWYATPLSFYIGHIYNLNEPAIISFLRSSKNNIFACAACFAVLCLMFFFSSRYASSLSTVTAYTLLPVLTVITLIRLNMSKLAANRYIILLGCISFEIYLIHGVVMEALRQYTELHGIVFVVLTLLITLLLSMGLRTLTDWIKVGIVRLRFS